MPSKVALGFPRISILNNSVKQVRQYELEDLVDVDADEGKQNNDGTQEGSMECQRHAQSSNDIL